jgi:hypothetical protein
MAVTRRWPHAQSILASADRARASPLASIRRSDSSQPRRTQTFAEQRENRMRVEEGFDRPFEFLPPDPSLSC